MSRQREITDNEPDWFELLNHARSMFIYHAGQRLNSTRYFFAIYGVIFAGYLTVLKESKIDDVKPYALLAISCFGLIVAIVYWLLDRRNAELVHVDENAMHFAERRILDSIVGKHEVDGFPNDNNNKELLGDVHKNSLNIAMLMHESPKSKAGFTYGNVMTAVFLFAIFAPSCAIIFHLAGEIFVSSRVTD